MSCDCDPSKHLQNLQQLHALTRRHFFKNCALGVGSRPIPGDNLHAGVFRQPGCQRLGLPIRQESSTGVPRSRSTRIVP